MGRRSRGSEVWWAGVLVGKSSGGQEFWRAYVNLGNLGWGNAVRGTLGWGSSSVWGMSGELALLNPGGAQTKIIVFFYFKSDLKVKI